jgi:Raf kinase inhibitor-like YbhB/YbcL family protein
MNQRLKGVALVCLSVAVLGGTSYYSHHLRPGRAPVQAESPPLVAQMRAEPETTGVETTSSALLTAPPSVQQTAPEASAATAPATSASATSGQIPSSSAAALATTTPPPAAIQPAPPPVEEPDLSHIAKTLKLSMQSITAQNNRLPLDYTCYKNNATPPMAWSGAPSGTKSYVVFMEQRRDGKPSVLYWSLYAIPATTAKLPAGLPAKPADGSLYGANDRGIAGYVGPCDPKGQVKYVMRLFALDAVPALPAGAHKADVIHAMNGHIVDESEVDFIHYYRL